MQRPFVKHHGPVFSVWARRQIKVTPESVRGDSNYAVEKELHSQPAAVNSDSLAGGEGGGVGGEVDAQSVHLAGNARTAEGAVDLAGLLELGGVDILGGQLAREIARGNAVYGDVVLGPLVAEAAGQVMLLPMCHMKLREVYPALFVTTVVATSIGTAAVSITCALFPQLG